MFYDGLGSLSSKVRGFEIVSDEYRKHPNVDIQLPTRNDGQSAGYDFYTPVDITIMPGERCLVWTDIKAYMQESEVLMLHVRSSIGVKKGVILSNGTGIIDASYYNNAINDGCIGISLYNTSEKIVKIQAGDRIAQGVFMQYLISDDDIVLSELREGGFGSSGN